MRDLGFAPNYEPASDERAQLCWRRQDASTVDWRKPWMRGSGQRKQGSRSPREHVATLLAMRPKHSSLAEEMTLTDAVALLGTKPSALIHAARLGYVVVSRRDCKGKITSFDASSIREFDAEFIFNGRVAARFSAATHTIYGRMRAKGFLPEIWPRNGIEGAWRRLHVESLQTLMPL
jgi:hypothetical protein